MGITYLFYLFILHKYFGIYIQYYREVGDFNVDYRIVWLICMNSYFSSNRTLLYNLQHTNWPPHKIAMNSCEIRLL